MAKRPSKYDTTGKPKQESDSYTYHYKYTELWLECAVEDVLGIAQDYKNPRSWRSFGAGVPAAMILQFPDVEVCETVAERMKADKRILKLMPLTMANADVIVLTWAEDIKATGGVVMEESKFVPNESKAVN